MENKSPLASIIFKDDENFQNSSSSKMIFLSKAENEMFPEHSHESIQIQ